MQTIEFESKLQNGIINIPPVYQHWQEGKKVKVIILKQDEDTDPMPMTNLSQYAGVISLKEDPLNFQRTIRDEWV